ncbi:hypothetical protein [Cetobacterium sp.]|uniref:hypothetical protein n=1 Tax=Cetobacterium sp. TaxID=2071632 RepID=UPI003F328021
MNTLTAQEIQDFVNYLKVTGYTFEVEEANDKYKKLVTSLDGTFKSNSHYYRITNKWGCECRLYFYNFENLPEPIKNKLVSAYYFGGPNGSSGPYTIRINDTEFILNLVRNYNFRTGAY